MHRLRKVNPAAVAIVTPSDQYIGNTKEFVYTIQECVRFADVYDVLVTMGITPTYPATGYGYIQAQLMENERISKVVRFKEKPDIATATQYLSQGNYYWN